jgi:ribonuclease R
MLAANVCAASLLQEYEHLGVYRIHAGPTKEKLTQVRNFLRQVGLNLTGGDSPSASDYAQLMGKIKMRPDSQLLQTMLLRSMQQAVYSPDNIGHFGLSYDAYAHFTSPIRRYPDLLTHRAIKAILAGKKYEPKGIDTSILNTAISNAARKQMAADRAAGKERKQKEITIWDMLGTHCSANERRADEASRDVEAWLKCYFMKNKLGEEFTGTITGVTQFGLFVQLDEMFVEGLVHITDLGADYFQFDEARHELRGERSGKRYQLTDKIKVQVSRVDIDARKIDLALAAGSVPNRFPKVREFEEASEPRGGKRKAASTQVAEVSRSNGGKTSKPRGANVYAEPVSKTKTHKSTVASSRGDRKSKVSNKASKPARKKR